MTHADLVARAARWLANTRKCVLVLQEVQCWSIDEFPDAIGWTLRTGSILVECKMSRGDFHADKRKRFRQRRRESMGRERWYLTPPGLLNASDLPEGYGLIELHGRTVRKIVEAATAERPGRQDAEMPLLLHAVRKEAWGAGWKGRMVRLACKATQEPA